MEFQLSTGMRSAILRPLDPEVRQRVDIALGAMGMERDTPFRVSMSSTPRRLGTNFLFETTEGKKYEYFLLFSRSEAKDVISAFRGALQ